MKKKLSAILLIIVAAFAMLSFTACTDESIYGTYEDANNRVILILEEDRAYFGSLDTQSEFYVKYVDGGKYVGINKDELKCYLGEFTTKFTNNGDNTISYEGIIPTDGNDPTATDEKILITLIKK